MLVLSRRENERIRLGDSIVITVVRVAGDKVRLGIEAPSDVRILRDELLPHETAPIEKVPIDAVLIETAPIGQLPLTAAAVQ